MANYRETIKSAIKRKRLTQQKVADEMEISLRQLQNYIDGNFPKHNGENIKKLDRILGTEIYATEYENKFPRGTPSGAALTFSEAIAAVERAKDAHISELKEVHEKYQQFKESFNQMAANLNSVQARLNGIEDSIEDLHDYQKAWFDYAAKWEAKGDPDKEKQVKAILGKAVAAQAAKRRQNDKHEGDSTGRG